MLLKHSAFYLVARGLPGVINFTAVALYTRLLLPEEYGQYSIVLAGVGFGNVVLFQWLRLGLLRFLPNYQEQREKFLSNLAAGFLGIVLVVSLPGIAVLWLCPEQNIRHLITLGIILLFVQAWFELNLELARSQLAPLRYGVLGTVKAFLALFTGGLLAYLGWGTQGLLGGLILGISVPVLWITRREWHGIHLMNAEFSIFKKLLSYGLPLTVTFVFGFVVDSSDRLLLGWFIGSGAAGLYTVGHDLAKQSLGVLMMTVNLAAYPLAVRAFERGGKDFAIKQLTQNVIVFMGIALPAAVGFSMLAPNITGLFLGREFRETALALIPWITVAAFLAGFKAYYLDLSFQLGQYTLGQVWVMLVAAIVNLGLNLWWIPRLGVMGAAYATVVAYSIATVMSWALGRRIFPLPWPQKEFIKITFATLCMTLVLLQIIHYQGVGALIAQISLGFLVYCTMFFILDILNFRSILIVRFKLGIEKRGGW